ncbi:NAD(P)/FAD-dependent oxidoreductase [Mucilaginibacter defluvii]|uniref:FAD-dependent oxidoreductase n=1 Tax=Mucilaginibacter defluvii TaxID=1196019 RepID=A0ABP9FT89_9SPHI
MEAQDFKVIVVGGSYSGLSAAMTLGRSLRKTLVIDSAKPCNHFTPHSHNFLTQDGMTPQQIAKIAKEQVEKYASVTFISDEAIKAERLENTFIIETKSGQVYKTAKLVFSTGIKDIMPDIKGFVECWGKSVIHCPYCHGYEYRDQKTAIWVNEENAFHLAPLIRNLTQKVTVLTNGAVRFTTEERSKFNKNGIRIEEGKIAELEHSNGQLRTILFQDARKESFDALYTQLPFEQHCGIPSALGCEYTDKGYLKTDMFFKTTVEGVYACGDNTSPFRAVSNAVANGNFAGATINRELASEQF